MMTVRDHEGTGPDGSVQHLDLGRRSDHPEVDAGSRASSAKRASVGRFSSASRNGARAAISSIDRVDRGDVDGERPHESEAILLGACHRLLVRQHAERRHRTVRAPALPRTPATRRREPSGGGEVLSVDVQARLGRLVASAPLCSSHSSNGLATFLYFSAALVGPRQFETNRVVGMPVVEFALLIGRDDVVRRTN